MFNDGGNSVPCLLLLRSSAHSKISKEPSFNFKRGRTVCECSCCKQLGYGLVSVLRSKPCDIHKVVQPAFHPIWEALYARTTYLHQHWILRKSWSCSDCFSGICHMCIHVSREFWASQRGDGFWVRWVDECFHLHWQLQTMQINLSQSLTYAA